VTWRTIDAAVLREIMPYAGTRADLFAGPLANAMIEFGIIPPPEQAMFLAQLAHESGSLRYVREIASGAAYEGRADLGNTQPGDGRRYRGRGLIQITGRENYARCSDALYDDWRVLIDAPETLEKLVPACRSAAWFWWDRKLDQLVGKPDELRRITRRINGGYNGLADRRRHWERAKRALGVTA
jgi:putative chitinase